MTRQSANLMEDFSRELKADASLFLLYGESDVGKTRLLQELSQNRLADRSVYWLDLDKDKDEADSMHDHAREVETVFAGARQGDIIIADHFESSLKKARHQLFLSWSTDGIDKQLNLIIASSNEGFDELRQLGQQYQVTVRSFQQMPFSAEEVNAFIGFYLFPEHPIGKLSIPGSVRKQLAASGGAVGKIIDILERDGAEIGSSSAGSGTSMSPGRKTAVTVVIALVLAIGAGWFYLDSQSRSGETATETVAIQAEPMEIVELEPEVGAGPASDDEMVAQAEAEPAVDDEIVTQAEVEPAGVVVAAVVAEASDEQMTEAEPEVVLEPGIETESVTVLESDDAGGPAAQDTVIAEPGTASDTDAIIVEEVDYAGQQTEPVDAVAAGEQSETEAEPEPEKESSSLSRFERELEKSRDWINGKAGSIGTMQILMLSYKTFDEAVYYDYVDSLARKQVDINQLKVFKTFTGGAEVYSVFYGEYASRKAALEAKNDLPQVLRKISPIPRSVGGIMQEIQRLETES